MIQQIVNEITRCALEHPTVKNLMVAIEAQQRFMEYLDELEVAEFDIDTTVTVKVDGKTIRFEGIEDVTTWITSQA